MDRTLSESVQPLLASLADVPWFAFAGHPSDRYLVVPDAVVGWDDWNDAMLAVWRPATERLEKAARGAIGDEAIDEVFRLAGEHGAAAVRRGLQGYFDRRPDTTASTKCSADAGLWPEILDAVLRDTAWCAIELALGRHAFFSAVMDVYREGRWPCSWDGAFPEGRFVVL